MLKMVSVLMAVKFKIGGSMLRRRRVIGVLLMVAVVVVGSICAPFISRAYSSEDPPSAGSILFFIGDSATYYGLPNAIIEIYEGDKLITTITADESGHARFDAKMNGTYITKVKAEGYRALEGNNRLEAGGREFELDVILDPLKESEYTPNRQLEEDARSKGDVIFRAFIIDRKSGNQLRV
ncbi:MAG: hypothetical protein HZB33_14630 [Nitrospirae bacterium]|nr:hypothetical protein [Nitrospirota bacterium]